MDSMRQELVNLLAELDQLGRSGAHTFILSVGENDMDADMWVRLQSLLKEINSKSQEAFLLSSSLRRS